MNHALAQEIEGLLEVYEDSEENPHYGEDDALSDVLDRAETNEEWRSLLRPARKEAIKRGWFREITDEQLERTQVSSGKKYDFKMNGIKYVWVPQQRREK